MGALAHDPEGDSLDVIWTDENLAADLHRLPGVIDRGSRNRAITPADFPHYPHR